MIVVIRRFVKLLGISAAFLAAPPRLSAQTAGLPPEVKRVLFLGDSITYAGSYTAFIETYLITRHPERTVEFLNLGLPSETVSGLSEPGHAGGAFPRPDLHERLARLLPAARPDLVFACYGMNDGIYLPFDGSRAKAYQDGCGWLHNEVVKTGAKIVFITPPVFDDKKDLHAGYNDVLTRYSGWLLSKRPDWTVADVHTPMTTYLAEHRRADPAFAFAGDGVHPNAEGHWVMAKAILEFLGAKDLADARSAAEMAAAHPHGTEILKLVLDRENLNKDAWLTTTGHKRPGMAKGVSTEEAAKRSAEIQVRIDSLTRWR